MSEHQLDSGVIEQAQAWRAEDVDPATQTALSGLVESAEAGEASAIAELNSAFAGPLEFGTAGLRGPLGPGPARMNRVVVLRAAAGLARYLRQLNAVGPVIVGYDARYNSDVFARDTAEVLSGAGFETILIDSPTPTPVIAFGIRHFGCAAAVVVTASHNPPQDNGYKVYLGDGSQIVAPADSEIAEQIALVTQDGPVAGIDVSAGYRTATEELLAAYVERAASLVAADAPKELDWVYTPLHGVGARVVDAVVAAAGFSAGTPVAEQVQPDPDFPTVAFPNPEEPGAIDLALSLATNMGADVVLANDPDADRCAVAAPVDGHWRMLTGDELGALLADDALRRGVAGVYACSVVSSTLLHRIANAYAQPSQTTLTGFKWIGRVRGLAFGYEEAIGYCCDPAAVADKDGITALLRVLALAAELRSQGETLADRLDEIAQAHGLHATDQLSFRVADLSIIADAMHRLRQDPPRQLLGEDVAIVDLGDGTAELPPTDAMEFTGDSLHVVVRPSGTEPKLKCYLEVRFSPEESVDVSGARVAAAQRLSSLREEMSRSLGL